MKLLIVLFGFYPLTSVLAQQIQPPTITTTVNPAYLAANCTNCHGAKGTVAPGSIPSLDGLQKEYVIEQMKAFREGKRQATIMHQLAKGYTDEQINLIAEYFAQKTTGK